MSEFQGSIRAPATIACHLCEEGAVSLLPSFSDLARVTSDCRPWPKGGSLGVCERCGGVQKVADGHWLKEIEAIYAEYAIYHQSGGAEQAVFDPEGGRPSPRSMRLLDRLNSQFAIGGTGRLLDIGCGNGALLRAFATIAPNWSLTGTEWGDKYRSAVEAIPGVEGLYTGASEDVPGRFDIVTMIHVLEHIPSPRAFLERLKEKLVPGGLLVIEVPDHRQNPFELMIADHASHFSSTTLASLLAGAGYETLSVADDWVPKELTVVATPGAPGIGGREVEVAGNDRERLQGLLSWLVAVSTTSRAAAEASHFGLFGTSIASTWLTGELGDRVKFYVDEDPERIGKVHLGRPIHHPSRVSPGSRVFLALPPTLAELVHRRLASSQLEYVRPPTLPQRSSPNEKHQGAPSGARLESEVVSSTRLDEGGT